MIALLSFISFIFTVFGIFGIVIMIGEKSFFGILFYSIWVILGIFTLRFLKNRKKQKKENESIDLTQKEIVCKNENDVKLKYEHNTERTCPQKIISIDNVDWVAKYRYSGVAFEKSTDFDEIFDYDDIDINERSQILFHGNLIGSLISHQDMVSDFLSRGDIVRARIYSIKDKTLWLYFYKKREEVTPPLPEFTCKLSGNSNQEMQLDISCCNVGDEVYIDYDYDKEKYLASSGAYELGYISKSKSKNIEELEDNGYYFKCYIKDISEDLEKEKLSVTISIKPK